MSMPGPVRRSRRGEKRTMKLRTLWAVAAWALGCGPAMGQSYPVKNVRIIVPAAAGGGVDIMARLLGSEFTQALGQQFIVENRSPSVAAADMVAKAAADGYTLLMSTATYLVNGALHKSLPYDPLRDFATVSLIGSTPIIIVAHPSLPVRSIKDLIALARQKPGALNFGSGGIGSPLHLAGELLRQNARIDIVHIAYKGTAPATIDLLAGQVQLMFPTVLSMFQYIQAGRIKVLAVMNAHRSPTLPNVQTTAEAGFPELTASVRFGLLAPRNTARPAIDQLYRAVVKALRTQEFRERLLKDDVEPIGSSPDEFAAFASVESAKWTRVIRSANIKPE
jgi:tripartite-type tricarboxylate transporter receptor subunit TctC